MKPKTNFKTGDKFNKLTIISLSHKDKHHRKHFNVICDCGNTKTVQGSLLSSNNTKSCGCFADQLKRESRISEHHCEITAIILQYKRHAKSRNLSFDLSRSLVSEIVSMNCHYCGIEPSNFMKTKNSIIGLPFNGIDRVDSSIGYFENNVVPCCKICNNAKSNLPLIKFKEWVLRIGEKAMAQQWSSKTLELFS